MSGIIDHVTLGKDTTLRQKELEKFDTNDSGETIVRTSAIGEFSISGLKTGGQVTEVTINDAGWTLLPGVALANRNAIAIQNYSGVEIKLNYDNTVVGYEGVIMINGSERQYDVTDAIPIYGRSSAGNVDVIVEELA